MLTWCPRYAPNVLSLAKCPALSTYCCKTAPLARSTAPAPLLSPGSTLSTIARAVRTPNCFMPANGSGSLVATRTHGSSHAVIAFRSRFHCACSGAVRATACQPGGGGNRWLANAGAAAPRSNVSRAPTLRPSTSIEKPTRSVASSCLTHATPPCTRPIVLATMSFACAHPTTAALPACAFAQSHAAFHAARAALWLCSNHSGPIPLAPKCTHSQSLSTAQPLLTPPPRFAVSSSTPSP